MNFLSVTLQILGKEFSRNTSIITFRLLLDIGNRLENQEISLVKTIEHLSKAADYLFS